MGNLSSLFREIPQTYSQWKSAFRANAIWNVRGAAAVTVAAPGNRRRQEKVSLTTWLTFDSFPLTSSELAGGALSYS